MMFDKGTDRMAGIMTAAAIAKEKQHPRSREEGVPDEPCSCVRIARLLDRGR